MVRLLARVIGSVLRLGGDESCERGPTATAASATVVLVCVLADGGTRAIRNAGHPQYVILSYTSFCRFCRWGEVVLVSGTEWRLG